MNPYLAVEVGWLRHPKVRRVHRDARSLWVAGGLHAVEHETDGVIEKHMLGLIAAEADVKPSRAAELVDAGLWEDWGDRYVIHDFLIYNPSKAEREERRERWRKQKEKQRGFSGVSTADTHTDTGTDSSQESSTLLSSSLLSYTKPSVKTLARADDETFAQFWACYPRKVGKPAAQTAFAKALTKTEPSAIGDGLRVWCDYWQTQGDQQFVPHPTTWLNQERWNDRPPPPAKPRANEGIDYLLTKMTNANGTAIETRET